MLRYTPVTEFCYSFHHSVLSYIIFDANHLLLGCESILFVDHYQTNKTKWTHFE